MVFAMQGWHSMSFGLRKRPRDINGFEMTAFFTLDGAEREAINARRSDSHKLGLALHTGFLRMSGRLLYAFRVVPVGLWPTTAKNLALPPVDANVKLTPSLPISYVPKAQMTLNALRP